MLIYRTTQGIIIAAQHAYYLLATNWDELIQQENPMLYLQAKLKGLSPLANAPKVLETDLLPPVVSQEIWAAGVTYYRSKEARMEESQAAGGGDFYDRVYQAQRPELFFKSTAARAVGQHGRVRIRKDSQWNVPEPELTLVINPLGNIIGYTIGNDMSSRDIEGENPLYLPQAKSYDGAAAVGPGILLSNNPLPISTSIQLDILRAGELVFSGQTQLNQLKRQAKELVHYLFREMSFPYGCLLMTGTGIVPPDDFTLAPHDEIQISIAGIGTLVNIVDSQ